MRWKPKVRTVYTSGTDQPENGDYKFKIKFALIPHRLNDGTWVWLEKYISRWTWVYKYLGWDQYTQGWGKRQNFDYQEFPDIIETIKEKHYK